MMLSAFLYGVLLALGLIIPLGMQNIFIFNQGAHQRHFLHALPSVITAFLCDSLLIISAVLGVSVMVLAIPGLRLVLLGFGVCFLAYMGAVTWFSEPHGMYAGKEPLSARQQILFSMSVSLLNPHALLDSVGVIGTSSVHFVGFYKVLFTSGCVLVSGVWFFVLAVLGHFFHKADKAGHYRVLLNKCSALVMWGVALYMLCII